MGLLNRMSNVTQSKQELKKSSNSTVTASPSAIISGLFSANLAFQKALFKATIHDICFTNLLIYHTCIHSYSKAFNVVGFDSNTLAKLPFRSMCTISIRTSARD
jgi:hypothetical protein